MAEIPLVVNLKIGNMADFKKGLLSAVAGKDTGGGGAAGGGAPGAFSIGKASVIFTVIQKGIEAMIGVLKGIFEQVKLASPALQGMELLLQKAMIIFFKPFGDFLATILKPVLLALFKWVREFSPKVKEALQGGATELEAGGTTVEINLSELFGLIDLSIVDFFKSFARIGEFGAEVISEHLPEIGIAIGNFFSALGIAIAGLGIGIGTLLVNIDSKELGKFFFEITKGLVVLAAGITIALGTIGVGFLSIVTFSILSLALEFVLFGAKIIVFLASQALIFIKDLKLAFDNFVNSVIDFFTDIKDNAIKTAFATIDSVIAGIVNFVENTFGIDLEDLFTSITDTIQDAITFLQNLINNIIANPFGTASDIIGGLASSIFGSKATGTDFVPQTGLYQLHRGEQVLPASQAGRGGGATNQNFNLTTNVTITNPDMTSDQNIAQVAEKLAIYQKEALRRGLSYG